MIKYLLQGVLFGQSAIGWLCGVCAVVLLAHPLALGIQSGGAGQALGKIRGSIGDVTGAHPSGTIVVRLTSSHGWVTEVDAVADLGFAFEDLAPGRYVLEAVDEGGLVTYFRGVVVRPGCTTRVRLILGEPCQGSGPPRRVGSSEIGGIVMAILRKQVQYLGRAEQPVAVVLPKSMTSIGIAEDLRSSIKPITETQLQQVGSNAPAEYLIIRGVAKHGDCVSARVEQRTRVSAGRQVAYADTSVFIYELEFREMHWRARLVRSWIA